MKHIEIEHNLFKENDIWIIEKKKDHDKHKQIAHVLENKLTRMIELKSAGCNCDLI